MAAILQQPVRNLGLLQVVPGKLQPTTNAWSSFFSRSDRKSRHVCSNHSSRDYSSEIEWQRDIDKETQVDAVLNWQNLNSDEASSRTPSKTSSPARSLSASSATSLYSSAEEDAKQSQKPQRQLCNESEEAKLWNDGSRLEDRFAALRARSEFKPLQSIKEISWNSVADEDVPSLCAAYDATSKASADLSHVSAPVKQGNALSNDVSVKSLHHWKHFIGTSSTTFTPAQPNINRPDRKQFHATPPEYVIDTSYLAQTPAKNCEELAAQNLSTTETQCSERLAQQQNDQQEQDCHRLIITMMTRSEVNEIRLDQAIRAMRTSGAIRASQKAEENRLAEQFRIEQENRAKAIALQKQLEEAEALAEERRAAEKRARFRECNVCGDMKDKTYFNSTTPTTRCKHDSLVCKECLDSWISSTLTDRGVDGIKCPEMECSEMLEYGDVKVAANAKTFETYDQMTTINALSALPEFAWCLSPGCKSGQLNIENSNFMHCKACGYKQCLKHQVEWHAGEDCKTYEYRTSGAKSREEEAKTLAMLDSMSKVCPGPGCGWRIQKTEGCDHVTCRKCKFEFCWQCLASHKEIKTAGNTAHKKGCKFHSDNLDIAWPFNRH